MEQKSVENNNNNARALVSTGGQKRAFCPTSGHLGSKHGPGCPQRSTYGSLRARCSAWPGKQGRPPGPNEGKGRGRIRVQSSDGSRQMTECRWRYSDGKVQVAELDAAVRALFRTSIIAQMFDIVAWWGEFLMLGREREVGSVWLWVLVGFFR